MTNRIWSAISLRSTPKTSATMMTGGRPSRPSVIGASGSTNAPNISNAISVSSSRLPTRRRGKAMMKKSLTLIHVFISTLRIDGLLSSGISMARLGGSALSTLWSTRPSNRMRANSMRYMSAAHRMPE